MSMRSIQTTLDSRNIPGSYPDREAQLVTIGGQSALKGLDVIKEALTKTLNIS